MSIRLADYIDPALVVTGVRADSVPALFAKLRELLAAARPDVDAAAMEAALLEREHAQSTSLGCGLAVPHAMVPGVERSFCVVARLAAPLAFDSTGGVPVRLVFVLASPPGAVAMHVRLLARIARLCQGTAFLERLLAAPDAAALRAVLVEEDERHV